MNALLGLLVLLPLITVAFIVILGSRSEKSVSFIALVSNIFTAIIVLSVVVAWMINDFENISLHFGYLYESKHYQFPITLFFDLSSFFFLVMSTFISMVVVKFSRHYLHREEGFSRFFAAIFLFLGGVNLLSIAGTLDLFFAAWEMIGVSSFLLIGFYRDRVQPVRNALHAFAVYRMTDLGLFLGAFLSHIIFKGGIFFANLTPEFVLASVHPSDSHLIGLLSVLFVLSAMGKSAQFPFSFWLPKAMEGPTPSSAIFYGGLAVHAGVFLLIRTFAIWRQSAMAIALVTTVGLVTAILATMCGRTQSSVKGQIAYASIAQVGLMFIGLGFGLKIWVLVHMTANVFLRSYQLLVSPSAVVQVLQFQSRPNMVVNVSEWSMERLLPNKLRTNLYVFSLNEAYLEAGLRRFLWRPLATFANIIFGAKKNSKYNIRDHWRWGFGAALFSLLVMGCLFLLPFSPIWSVISMALALFCGCYALSERHSYWLVWNSIGISSFFSGMTIFLLDSHLFWDGFIFLSGVLPCWIIGSIIIAKIPNYWSLGRKRNFMGLAQIRPNHAFYFLICTLGIIGFPLFPTFLGEDLLLHAHTSGTLLPILPIGVLFVLNGIVAVRTYAMLCLGPNRFLA